MLAFVVALLMSQAAAPSTAPRTPAQTETSAIGANYVTANQAQRNQVVCQRTRVTGTNRVERVCATVAQRDDAREAAIRLRENNSGGVPTNNPTPDSAVQ